MDNSDINLQENEYPLHPSDPAIIPDSTYWPISMAFGITLLFWGLISSLILSGVGLVCMIVALAGWIRELNNEK